MNNREYAASDKEFIEACKRAGIPPTQRQASKFRLKTGRAYQFRNGTHVDNSEELGIQIFAEQE
jgi:hypothetical protein